MRTYISQKLSIAILACSLGMTVQPMDVNDSSIRYYMKEHYGFCYACRHKNCEAVKLLVARDGANTRNDRAETYLHSAIKENYFEAVKYVIEQGAYLNVKDNKGQTPLLCIFDNFYYRLSYHHSNDFLYPKDIALLLLDCGANPFEKCVAQCENISAHETAKLWNKTDLVILFETYFLRKTTRQGSRGKKLENITFRFESR